MLVRVEDIESMSVQNPRVLVGCPISDYHSYCVNEYLEGLRNIKYDNFEVVLVDNSKDDSYSEFLKKQGFNVIKMPYVDNARDRIIFSRNKLKEFLLENGFDYFLSLEADVIAPVDIIDRLLLHSKNVVSAVYFNNLEKDKKIQTLMMLWVNRGEDKETIYHVSELELENPRLIEVAMCGLGCVLISRVALEKIEFRYDKSFESFDDVWFCKDVKKEGFRIYGDTGVVCKHLFLKRPWEWKELKT